MSQARLLRQCPAAIGSGTSSEFLVKPANIAPAVRTSPSSQHQAVYSGFKRPLRAKTSGPVAQRPMALAAPSAGGNIDGSQIRTVLIDLDDCLYDIPEFPRLMQENIQRYMETKLDFPGHNVSAVCADLYLGHGTTLAGIVTKGHNIDYVDWHAHAHGVLPYELVRRDEKLRAILQAIRQPKWVFTNADRLHAERCLKRLGIADLFEGVICFETTMAAAEAAGIVKQGKPVICKPNHAAMELALQAAGGAQPATTLICDDSLRNIAAGKAIGMHTVLVRKSGSSDAADIQVASLHELPAAVPELFASAAEHRLPDAEAANGNTPLLTQNGAAPSSATDGSKSGGNQPAAAEAVDGIRLLQQQESAVSLTCREQQCLGEEQPQSLPGR